MGVGPPLADPLGFANRFVNSLERLGQIDVVGERRQERDRRIAVGFEADGKLDRVSGNEERMAGCTGC